MLDFLRAHLDAPALLEFLRTNLGALFGIAAALLSAAAASVIVGQIMRARQDRQIGTLIQSFANQSKGWNWVGQELEELERRLMARALPSDDLRAVGDKLRPLLAEIAPMAELQHSHVVRMTAILSAQTHVKAEVVEAQQRMLEESELSIRRVSDRLKTILQDLATREAHPHPAAEPAS